MFCRAAFLSWTPKSESLSGVLYPTTVSAWPPSSFKSVSVWIYTGPCGPWTHDWLISSPRLVLIFSLVILPPPDIKPAKIEIPITKEPVLTNHRFIISWLFTANLATEVSTLPLYILSGVEPGIIISTISPGSASGSTLPGIMTLLPSLNW